MKWQVWGSFDGDSDEFLTIGVHVTPEEGNEGLTAALVELGEQRLLEFETPEEPPPAGLGPPSVIHFRAAAVGMELFSEGYSQGSHSPRRRCAVHAGEVHGLEATELRRGIERLISGVDVSCYEMADFRDGLVRLLDRVDARDSLAHLEKEAKSE